MEIDSESIAKIIEALAKVAWPVLVGCLILLYRKCIASIIESAKNRSFTLEFGGQKLSMEQYTDQQSRIIEDLQAQFNELKTKVEGTGDTKAEKARSLSAETSESFNVLWVDDNPANNSYFTKLLQDRGYRIDLALTTQDGLAAFERKSYRLILSDMGRKEDGSYNQDAGLDLIKHLQERHISTPIVIFCSGNAARRFREAALSAGASAITSSPTELVAILDKLAPAPQV